MTTDATIKGGLSTDHRLVVRSVQLVGGGRKVNLSGSLNLILGDITTGKTTFVHLLRGLLGSMPDSLPPEVDNVRALRGDLSLCGVDWLVYRPRTTTADAPVEVARRTEERIDDHDAIRLKATGATGSYSRFMLDQLRLPAVQVPEGSKTSPGRLTSISMTDWLNYCIVPGDELDSQVFGSLDQWRDKKRRWIFELVYGLYDVETARMVAERRGIELQLEALEVEEEVIARFLSQTPFASRGTLDVEIESRQRDLENVRAQRVQVAKNATADGATEGLREDVLRLQGEVATVREARRQIISQLDELRELRRQLVSQSAKLTRAIVSGEWLVDFDFLVCPRCGSDVVPGSERAGICYLCHHEEEPANAQDVLLAEQDRVVSQIGETDEIAMLREEALAATEERITRVESEHAKRSAELDLRMSAFVSERLDVLEAQSAREARLTSEVEKLTEYGALLDRREQRASARKTLEEAIDRLDAQIESRTVAHGRAEENIVALEKRMLEYLEALHIPQLADTLTVRINRTTYLPEVSGRSFRELSSQGLKTLVNCAHAIAHHTVAIDRGLPLPGFLVLDGLSANAGHEGFDQARVVDLYRLLISVSERYSDTLQLVAVDNEFPAQLRDELTDLIALQLSQSNRLIREEDPAGAFSDLHP